MNNGKSTKVFVTCGNVTGLAMSSFYDNWENKYIRHIVGSYQCDDLIQSELTLQVDVGFCLLVDSEIDSMKMAEFLINIINENNIISLIIFRTHDERNTSLFQQILTQIQLNQRLTVNTFDLLSFEAAVGVYAHICSGFSLPCIDFDDVNQFFKSGTQLSCVSSKASSISELPYFMYTSFQQLLSKEKTDHLRLSGVVAVLINDDMDQLVDATNACFHIFSSLSAELAVQTILTNYQAGVDCEIELFGCYEVIEKIPAELQKSSNIPLFLRSTQ
jgi:hypothetical protein